MSRTSFKHDAKPDGPLVPAFREIPERPANGVTETSLEPAAKRTRQRKEVLPEVAEHLTKIRLAQQTMDKCQKRYDKCNNAFLDATEALWRAKGELIRLVATPPPETTETTETTNPEEHQP